MWDVDVVLKQLVSLGDKDLSLKLLSQKLDTLIALVQASTTTQIHAQDLRLKVFKAEGVPLNWQHRHRRLNQEKNALQPFIKVGSSLQNKVNSGAQGYSRFSIIWSCRFALL